ncbi:MAG: hypothetical protein EOO06_17450 [Chitinophagaceae bacterium]|nr:MAG: hypothetical protein EOO06_17450 [Chitinophagaceae bacterium]
MQLHPISPQLIWFKKLASLEFNHCWWRTEFLVFCQPAPAIEMNGIGGLNIVDILTIQVDDGNREGHAAK